MELKKSDKANLEKKRFIFFEIGLVFSLLLIVIAFEYTSSDNENSDTMFGVANIDETEMLDILTEPEEPKIEFVKPLPQKKIESTKIEETTNKNEDQSDKIKSTDENVSEQSKMSSDSYDESGRIFVRVQKMPQYPGGEAALYKYISQILTYPPSAVKAGIEGTVVVRFVVGIDGKARNPQIRKSVAEPLDNAAMAVIKKLPYFIPGEQGGKKVPVYFDLPIVFDLNK